MPRKVRPPADAAQNRENQQRSRARRREYVASLEARVRDFENREVQATLTMQRAARHIAWVNDRLMELLASKGVARAEVDEFLRRAGEDEGATAAGRRDADHGSGAGGESFGEGVPQGGKEGEQGRNAADTGTGRKGVSGDDDEEHQVCDGVSQTPKRSAGDTNTNNNNNTDEAPPALVTSCDDAASIIAGFQGHGDVAHARSVLGVWRCDELPRQEHAVVPAGWNEAGTALICNPKGGGGRGRGGGSLKYFHLRLGGRWDEKLERSRAGERTGSSTGP
ncbi:hypothetical protein CIB48_g3417 [Xylaria polymorpha]|nr:hypothetical protein CIB48_g3417 [Xylaria polymorpha]